MTGSLESEINVEQVLTVIRIFEIRYTGHHLRSGCDSGLRILAQEIGERAHIISSEANRNTLHSPPAHQRMW